MNDGENVKGGMEWEEGRLKKGSDIGLIFKDKE